MSKQNKKIKYPSFDKELIQELKDFEFKRYFNEYGKQLEIAYRILLLRQKQKITQEQLAKKLKTTQSAVARMEAGDQNFTVETLQRIADAFKMNLKIDFVN